MAEHDIVVAGFVGQRLRIFITMSLLDILRFLLFLFRPFVSLLLLAPCHLSSHRCMSGLVFVCKISIEGIWFHENVGSLRFSDFLFV